jgi:hypothetical protein
VLALGIPYNVTPLGYRLELPAVEVTEDNLYDTAKILLDETNALAEKLEFDESGSAIMPYSLGELSEKISAAYSVVAEKYDFIPDFSSRVKPIATKDALSNLHLLGIYTYFTGESNINVHYPDFNIPYTTAHEFAHQRGIARENEANFIAYLVCISSEDAYIRYSGSPIPMGFGEADQKKQAVILETSGREITVRTVDVPRFQRLEKISGDRATIENRLTELALSPESVWVEIVCTSDEHLSDLKERILKRCGDNVSILRIRMARQNLHMLEADPEQDMLEDMDVLHVFQKKLQEHFPETPLEESPCAPLLLTFEEALRSFQQEEESCAS